MIGFLPARILGLPAACARSTGLLPVFIVMVAVRRPDRADQGLGRRAVHLHAVLSRPCASLASPPFITTAPRRLSRTAASLRPRRRSASPARNSTPTIRAARSTIALSEAALQLDDIDYVVFYDKPFIKFERLLETYLTFSPRGFTSFRMALPLWLREKLFQKVTARRRAQGSWSPNSTGKSGCCSASITSATRLPPSIPRRSSRPPCSRSTASANGPRRPPRSATATILRSTRRSTFPHSLGLLYSAFTYYTGFKVNSGEYKLMGLAPYGDAALCAARSATTSSTSRPTARSGSISIISTIAPG